MSTEHAVKPMSRIENSRLLASPPRAAGAPILPADRSFKVLQPSHAPAQLSLFPPPGQVLRSAARHGR